MNEKPEALRLVNVFAVEKELCRQDAEIERLNAVSEQAQNAAIDLAYKYQRLREQLERIAYASMSTHLNAAQMVTSLQEIAKAALRREDL